MKSANEIVEMLKLRVSMSTQRAFAQRAGVSEQFLSDVLKRRREPTDRLLREVGYKRKVIYVRLKPEER